LEGGGGERGGGTKRKERKLGPVGWGRLEEAKGGATIISIVDAHT